jgi:hypothetical protein
VFRTDALENVLVFLAVKAAQGVPTEDIHPKGFAYLVPELFFTNRGVRLTFRPHIVDHKCGERFVNIQLKVSPCGVVASTSMPCSFNLET